ncbi:MAG: fluoride efflux transporter CrcB [Thermoanaerobaculia bacterium]
MRGVLQQAALVGLGGFVGSALRFLASGWVHRFSGSQYPWGTLAVNVLGSLVLGLLAGLADLRQVIGPGQRLFLMIGVLGGFTTFSTFALETVSLAQGGQGGRALANVAAHVALGLTAAAAGYVGARYLA